MALGRPKIKINKRQFEYLCSIMCTEEEIAGAFDCSISTLKRWCHEEYGETFEQVSKKKQAAGKISLRRSQFNLSEKNAAMAIFLGKNYLGQTDAPEDLSQGMEKLLDGVNKVLGGVDSVID